MYCRRCGSQIVEGTRYCPHCGAAQDPAQPNYQYSQPNNQPPQSYDSGSIGWGVLGFFIPLVGLILFLVWRTEKPKSAKSAGIGALIGTVLEIIPVIIAIIFFVGVFGFIATDPDGYYAITSLLSCIL